MASTVLPNGIIIPEKYSRDWYNDLYHNWQELDNLLGGGTPKDGTLTIQKNGTTVGTFSANQATNETINIEVPDVNNGTLTIQKNGTTVDTFTANSSTDKTVNITVPTKTSDLTNDSGFITEDTTKIPLAGSNQISGDLIPSTDGTVNLGASSYQWNNAYIKSLTINGVACGDILTHNASEFVKVTGDQTINGSKYFTSLLSKSNTLARGSLPTTNINEDPIFISADKNNRRTLALYNYYNTNGDGKVILYAYNQNTTNFDNVGLVFGFDNTNNSKSIYPVITNAYNLGTSTNKWKSFNGINPGALSLPSTSSGINLDLTNFKIDGSDNIFRLTDFSNYPYDNGWLFVRLNGCTSYFLDHWFKDVSDSYTTPSEAIFFLPINDKDHDITLRCVCTSINYIRVFPCQGNV